MPFMGADTDALIELGQRCRTGERRTDELTEVIAAMVAGVSWTGLDADTFREGWERARARLAETAGMLGGAAEHLGMQAAEQDRTSDPEGRIDADRYDGLVGGSSLWSDIINGAERLADPFRDRVTTESMGGSWKDSHPDWKPEDVPLDLASIKAARMQQGTLGDCWFLAALMVAQQTNPQLLHDNITPQGDPPGSAGWKVRLYVDGAWKDVEVHPDQIATQGAKSSATEAGTGYDDAGIGFMSIYEQAMINEAEGRPSAVSADSPAGGLEMILGPDAGIRESDTLGQPSFDEYKRAIDEGRPVTVMTDPLDPLRDDGQLVAAHMYQVAGYDEATGRITLVNPHGPHAASQYEVWVDPGDPSFYTSIFMTGMADEKG